MSSLIKKNNEILWKMYYVMVLKMGNNQRFWYVLKHEDQQWLVCAPLRIHLEPINKMLMLLVTIKERTVLHQIRSSLGQWYAIKTFWQELISCFNNHNDTLFENLHMHSYTWFHMQGRRGDQWYLPVLNHNNFSTNLK